MKKYLLIFSLFILFFVAPADAKTLKMIAQTQNDFSTETMVKNLTLKIVGDYKINDNQHIPSGLILNGEVVKITAPKRGKRGAVAYFELKSYTMPNGNTYSVNNPNAIGKITAYKPLDLKSKGVDLGVSAAGLLVENISYPINFVRGAVTAQEGENRLKAGVKLTYEKSTLSYISKGQHIIVPAGNNLIVSFKYKKK